jgi:hypothetical protein
MNFLKKFHAYEIALIVVILSIHLYAALSDAYNLPNVWFTRDDAYYYFKVAQNITQGLGSTFDGINLTNGYHPLWMIVCIPIFFLARFDLILPMRILLMVMAGLNAATAVLIYRLVKENLSHAAALLAAPFWAFNFYIHYVVYEFGLETPLAGFAVILFIYKLSQFERDWRAKPVTARQLVTLALIGIFVMLSRLDLVFLAIIGGVWVIFRKHPIRYFLPLDIVIVFLSLTCSVALRTNIELYNSLYAASTVKIVFAAIIIKVLALYFFGSYQHPRNSTPLQTIWKASAALTLGTILTAGVFLFLTQFKFIEGFPRSAFILDWVISTVLILALRLAAYRFGSEAATPAKIISPIKELQAMWRPWLSEGLIYYGILGSALAIYMGINKLMFGTTSPVSGQIKRWWGTLGNTVYDSPAPNWTSFLGIGYQWAYDAWQPTSNFFLWLAKLMRPIYPGSNTTDERYYIAMAISALFVLGILLANPKRISNKITNMALLPLIAGCGVQILSYTTTAYGGAKEWYWISEMLLVVIFESILFDILTKPFRKTNKMQLALQTTSIALGILFAARFGDYVFTVMRYNYYEPNRPYMEVLPYIEENTPKGAIIGMTGGGNVGYFIHDRTIVNMDGLINSYDYFKAVQDGEAPGYLSERGMTIVFASPRLLEPAPYFGQFDLYLEQYSAYGGKNLMYLWDKPKY